MPLELPDDVGRIARYRNRVVVVELNFREAGPMRSHRSHLVGIDPHREILILSKLIKAHDDDLSRWAAAVAAGGHNPTAPATTAPPQLSSNVAQAVPSPGFFAGARI
jgi:hypothetical protein